MTTKTALPRPPGHHTVTPGAVIPRAAEVLAFLQQAFGGEVVERYDGPDGAIGHAEVRLGDSIVMLGSPSPQWPAMPAALSFYVPTGADVDATYARALAHGATSLMEPADQFYGYRAAAVRDVGGNKWTICAVIEQVSPDEIARRMTALRPR